MRTPDYKETNKKCNHYSVDPKYSSSMVTFDNWGLFLHIAEGWCDLYDMCTFSKKMQERKMEKKMKMQEEEEEEEERGKFEKEA